MSTIENIKCTDSNGKLFLYNYTHCDNESETDIKECRGLVKSNEDKVVVKTFNYTEEYVDTEVEKITKKIPNIDDWDIRYSMEGTLIRVFFYDEEWYIATHKKLNAFKSRWSCRETFGDIFRKGLHDMFSSESVSDNILIEFLDQLDKTRTYLFLLRSNQENRIVCQAHFVKRNENIVYVGYFSDSFRFHINNGEADTKWLSSFIAPTKIDTPITSVADIFSVINEINHFEYQGLIFFNKHTNDHFKVVHHKYHELFLLRDNNPNLRFRYLELRNDPEKIKQLYTLYPRSADTFDEYENILYKIARMIYHFYVSRYIKNKYVTLPREEYMIMKKCHDWYLSDRVHNRIFTKKIMEFLGQEPPLHLYKMIRRFMANEPRQNYQNWNYQQAQHSFVNE